MLKYEILHEGSKSTVILEGDIDLDVTETIEEEVAPKLMDSKEVEINFDKVSFVDSSGIGLLISLVHELTSKDIKATITNIQPEIKHIFSLLQLPEILGQNVLVGMNEI
jgi:anti-anti-sigma factor